MSHSLASVVAAGAATSKDPSILAIVFFAVFVALTLGITFWASKRAKSTTEYFAAGRSIKGWQNGIAVAGDYMSAASFLGIAGIISTQGYDGFMYSVGWLVAYLTVLLIVAEPLRNLGKYTMADVLAYRMQIKSVRAAAALSTLTVTTFYMIAQMVGAGSVIALLLKLDRNLAVAIVGVVMLVYVVFGGMVATTWVQIVKALLLIAGTIVLSILVLAQFNFNLGSFFDQTTKVQTGKLVKDAPVGATEVTVSSGTGGASGVKGGDFKIGSDDGTNEIHKATDVVNNAPWTITLPDPLNANVAKDTKITDNKGNQYVVAAAAVSGDKAIKVDKTVPGVANGLSQKPILDINGQKVKAFAATPASRTIKLDAPLAHAYTVNAVAGAPTDFMKPGGRYPNTQERWGALDLISLGMALILGTAGLPHILVRFYTVPDAVEARKSVVWAMVLIGGFYVLTTFLGFGAAILVGSANIGAVNTSGTFTADSNLAAPLLADKIGGELFYAFIASVAFATILAVVAGLTITASTTFAHDVWLNIIRSGKERAGEQILVARITAFVVGGLAILLAIAMPGANAAVLVALAFAVAASANLPVILLTLFWKRFNTAGTVGGLLGGLFASLFLIVISKNFLMGADAPFQLENPGIVSIPAGFLSAIVFTYLSKETASTHKYAEMHFRAETGVGAEQAVAHGMGAAAAVPAAAPSEN
ncbi:MAG TPA: cation acetate symporter [Chloroflexia bacterium]|nr:cation acetate symporter [Chloroflexia bacterium]